MKYKQVHLGRNVSIGKNVILGEGSKDLGELIIGDNAKIRSGTVIYLGTIIGDNFQTGHNALIREHNQIGHSAVLGSFSELAPHNQIGNYTTVHGHCFLESVTLGDYVFVAPGVVFLDDLFPIDPDQKNYKGAFIGDDTAIGGHSTICPHLTIGSRVLIGAGSVVTKDVPDDEIWKGNPACFFRKTGYLPGTRKRYEKNN